ncbi:MAG: RNA polymerase sigma factor [Pararobbsia sp.]
MSDGGRTDLKTRLVARYAYLVKRLERFVGSKDGAAEALHETWLRLEKTMEVGTVLDADAYILRMAHNVVYDQHRGAQRYVSQGEIDEIFEGPDELADPERIVAARRKVDALKEAMGGLTPRRQAILLAARVDGQLNREIASRFGISLRLVEQELSLALKQCAMQMKDFNQPQEGAVRGRRKF